MNIDRSICAYICGIYKVKFTQVEWCLPRVERLGKWGDISQKVQSCSYVGCISSRGPVYSIVAIVNNTILYTGNLLKA